MAGDEKRRSSAGGPRRYDHIVESLIGVQKQLTRYIRALVPNSADADEILQETNLFLWRHANDYEPGTNFAAWAAKMAHYQVLSYRKRQTRARRRFSDVLIEQLASAVARNPDWQSDDVDAFTRCVDSLSEQDRALIRLRYEPGATVPGIAEKTGRSTDAVYKALGRMRTRLLECMRRALSERKGS